MNNQNNHNHLSEYWELCKRAHLNTSFTPEKRADQYTKSYSEILDQDLKEIHLATEDQKQRYIEGYKGRFVSWMQAKSNCLSSMITGGANFPVRRAEKANNTEHNQSVEFEEYRTRAKKAILKQVENAKPIEQKQAERWQKIEEGILKSCETIARIDRGEYAGAKPLFVSNLYGKIKTLANNGEVELVEKAINLVREFNSREEVKRPVITERHKFFKLLDVAKQVANNNKELETKQDKVEQYEGFTVTFSYANDRIRISHESKPSIEVRSYLKKNSFNWSRANSAWQRKFTRVAESVVKNQVIPYLLDNK